jgi:protocatechuate 3,4-dioxygenase beta subunit
VNDGPSRRGIENLNSRVRESGGVQLSRPPTSDLRPPTLVRREVMRAGAALALGAVTLRFPAAVGAQEAASPTAEVCVLTPELTEGPYYLPLELLREDITEGKDGLPLRLRVAVVDLSGGGCVALPEAAVDLWHCDAQGYYSGVSGNPGSGADPEESAGAESGTFLRGIQVTDGDGVAEFTTIYPGWYQGRTVHIHMKVHVGGVAEELAPATPAGQETYDGGQVAHTGQIFFDDAVSDQVYDGVEAYAGRDNGQRLRNEQDGILGDHADEPGFLVALEPLGADALVDGFLGTITIGVDASAEPEPAGFGGGPPDAWA